LAVAESCTGGSLAAEVVAISGSSNYFLGGVVAYSNEIKSRILNVSPETLEAHGAVSWQTAVEMAEGVRTLFGVDLALSTTGIAGPTGGTPTKPVGTVYIGLASKETAWWELHRWDGSRLENIAASVQASLSLLSRYLAQPDAPLAGSEAIETGQFLPTHSDDEPVSVELAGGATPVAFTWKGERFRVDSEGRSWEDADGGHHVLVMDNRKGSFELYRDPSGGWHLRRAWRRPAVA
jgi:nicotinamide-nucleotide amidase